MTTTNPRIEQASQAPPATETAAGNGAPSAPSSGADAAPSGEPARPPMQAPRPLRVLNIITRMILGGAQETALLTCALIDRKRFPSEIMSGLETGSEGELHGECRKRDIPLHFEPHMLRRVSPLNDLKAFFRLVGFLRRGHYDVVHTHSSKAGIIGRLAARAAGVPVIVHTVHGWGHSRGESRALYWTYVLLERLCATCCDALIVVGAPVETEGLSLGIGKPEQYHLIRSGIEVEVFAKGRYDRAETRRRIGVPDDAFVVGSVGRLEYLKAPLLMLDAFDVLAKAEPHAHMVMVGDGPERAEVEAKIAHLGLDGRVHLLGLRRDVPDILPAFDVFALSSRREGLPRVFPQAMAAGLPIVATRIDGAADAIENGENGYLVNLGDMQTMGERLIELARNPDMCRRMGEQGRTKVDEFSATRMVDQIAELYQALAVKKGVRF